MTGKTQDAWVLRRRGGREPFSLSAMALAESEKGSRPRLQPGCNTLPQVRVPQTGRLRRTFSRGAAMHVAGVDYAILAAYFALVLGIGFVLKSRMRKSSD